MSQTFVFLLFFSTEEMDRICNCNISRLDVLEKRETSCYVGKPAVYLSGSVRSFPGLSLICLTFKNRASHREDGHTTTLQILHFIYTYSTNISTEYFKHAAYFPFFSSKCRLFHNATFFGSCIIHILRTGCAKI
jgi:hypothetical protein